MHELVGKRVQDKHTKERGIIKEVSQNRIKVEYRNGCETYVFPAAFFDHLMLEDEELQRKYEESGGEADFEKFIIKYKRALENEILYLKDTGGKKYKIIDGECISIREGSYLYSFECDSELHFPDGTTIKLRVLDRVIIAYVLACEDFNILIQLKEDIGKKVDSAEFTAESWLLLESLLERFVKIDPNKSKIAYELACQGRKQISVEKNMCLGQDLAIGKVRTQPITFIWGPPGTGKTTTLANIALEFILNNKRVLMLSYSNVSVDGALLKVAGCKNMTPGAIIRYGYPRKKELLDSKTLTSYGYALSQNPELALEYEALEKERRSLKRNDPKRQILREKINSIREKLIEQEKKIIHEAVFVATTVSKAVVDKAVYAQKFDLVIFDEASMAYVPQVVYAASLAKERFCCLGDFKQLPAIVQNKDDVWLHRDIFEYTEIVSAVENNLSHNWLVILIYQYRMHHKIADFVSRYMYSNLLKTSENINKNRELLAKLPPISSKAMGYIDLSTSYSVCVKTKDGSRINLMSALMSVLVAEMFADQYEVGIITPYSAQSKLVRAILRDIQERNGKFLKVTTATVHQFQGSEKAVIIYDAVECYRMTYLGTMLTARENNLADRLFNVALTRTQGKFILIANKDYLIRKGLPEDLIFAKALKVMDKEKSFIKGDDIFKYLGTEEKKVPEVFMGDRDEEDSWKRYLNDIQNAKEEIFIELPGMLDEDEQAIGQLERTIKLVKDRHVEIYVRTADNILIPKQLRQYGHVSSYAMVPITIIDREIVWYGEPLSAADFISERDILETKLFICLRFCGKHAARIIKAIFEIPTLKEKRENERSEEDD